MQVTNNCQWVFSPFASTVPTSYTLWLLNIAAYPAGSLRRLQQVVQHVKHGVLVTWQRESALLTDLELL